MTAALRAAVLLAANLAAPAAALAILARFLLSRRRGVLLGLGEELSERFGGLPAEARRRLSGRPVVWVHAASAGEVAAVSPLLERLRRRSPRAAILVTTSTAAGRQRAKELACVEAASLAPLDTFPTAARFIAAAHPDLLLLVETELWPHLIELNAARGTPVALVNARLSPRSHARYRLLGPAAGAFLRRLRLIAAQSEEDARRFAALGADPAAVSVTGNLKFDRPEARARPETARALDALGWAGSPVLVAGSTHPGEEEAVIAAWAAARRTSPRLRLMLAPRHPERAAGAAAALQAAGLRPRLWSAGPGPAEHALVLDGLGVLPECWSRATLAFVGGTLVPVGGHSLIEPALAGKPVLFGPHTAHTADVAERLLEGGGGLRVADGAALAERLGELLADPARAASLGARARLTAEALRGASERTAALLEALLP